MSANHLAAPSADADEASWIERHVWRAEGLEQEVSWMNLSPWSRSAAKRLFDCVSVLLALPLLIPVMLFAALLVRLTSRGPVLFLQERVGQFGRRFTILKFRTMIHVPDQAHHPITTSENQRFTPAGPFLRRWKLDELPQILNVLLGHMSLVGPRPKLPEHVVFDPPCRPGITGMATNIFANEEAVLAYLPKEKLDAFYHAVVLPAKRRLDAEYMSRATFLSDFRLLINAVLRRWGTGLDMYILQAAFEADPDRESLKAAQPSFPVMHRPAAAAIARSASEEQIAVS